MVDRFSTIMGAIERDIGTKDLSLLILYALRDSIKNYRGATLESLETQLKEIIHIINNTEPKYAIVIDNIFSVYKKIIELIKIHNKNHHHKFIYYKKSIIKTIDGLIKNADKERKLILQSASNINLQNKTILIHDHSRTVQDVLWYLKKQKQKFKVVIAEQDMEKTLFNVEALTKHKIPFQVVPAHMLSNIEDEINMCFFGALTLKSTYDFVVDTGTNAIISEFHLKEKPIYIFMSVSKFSLWKAKKKMITNKEIDTRKHPSKKIQFERFKFSHDRVPLSSVDFTVTDQGIFKEHELKKLYQQKFKEHEILTKMIEKI
jgi:translation initiation factor 2B subunit (eIF-2B alpha/beta/delta family)